MASIYESVTAPAIAAYYNEKPKENAPYLLGVFFPDNKQLGTDLSYIKGAKGSVKPLSLSGYDAKAIPIGREGFEKLTTEIPFFKNSMNINEKQRKELLNVLQSGNQQVIDMVLNKIFDDETTLVDNAELTLELMRAQALTTGKIAFSSNGQSISFDYGVPAENKVTSDWTVTATADPLADITSWQDTIEANTGVRPNALIMNSTTLNKMKKVDAIKNAIYVFGDGKVTPNTAKIVEYLASEAGVTTYIYSKGYKNAEGAFTKFIPDDTVILLPDMALGNTWFAPTPEETDLMTSPDVANVSVVNTGVAITTIKETDPVNVMTKVSMNAMVSLEMANSIVIADVSSL